MNRNYVPLANNIIVKVEIKEVVSKGGIIIGAEGSRESMGREEGVIIAMGEYAFDDLNVKVPKVGDRVALAKYEGKILEEDLKTSAQIRAVQDTRVLCMIEETAQPEKVTE